MKLLGSGTYGKVVECEDHKYNKTHVAIKLVRREPPLYKISAKNEIAILRELDGRYGTLKLLRDFDHDGHVSLFCLMASKPYYIIAFVAFVLRRR